MYTDVSQNVTIFKGDSYCVTAGEWVSWRSLTSLLPTGPPPALPADYGLFPNGTVSVQNSARLKSPTGALDQILGWAAVVRAAPERAAGCAACISRCSPSLPRLTPPTRAP